MSTGYKPCSKRGYFVRVCGCMSIAPFFVVCGPFRDKHLIQYFRSEAFCGETHSALRYVFGDVHGEYMFINGLRFLVTYFINTTLFVIIHIKYTKKWAAEVFPKHWTH